MVLQRWLWLLRWVAGDVLVEAEAWIIGWFVGGSGFMFRAVVFAAAWIGEGSGFAAARMSGGSGFHSIMKAVFSAVVHGLAVCGQCFWDARR